MSRSDLENKMNQHETVGLEHGDVADMLGSLPRVEAPSDFEFGVKAKMAAGNAGTRAFLSFIKVAAPLSLILLIGAFAIFYATLPAGETVATTPGVAPETNSFSPAAPAAAAAQEPRSSEADRPTLDAPLARTMAPTIAAVTVPKKSEATPKKRTQAGTAREEGGGSTTQALGTIKVITAPGIPDPSKNRSSNNISGTGDIPIREILEVMGLKADFSGGGWIVRSAAKNSIASRAGIQSNDVIEAVNDQSVGEKTMLKNGFQGKSISVRRDGKSVELELKN